MANILTVNDKCADFFTISLVAKVGFSVKHQISKILILNGKMRKISKKRFGLSKFNILGSNDIKFR